MIRWFGVISPLLTQPSIPWLRQPFLLDPRRGHRRLRPPFVCQLIDGKPHESSLTVRDSQSFWLVSANLHLWLDAWSDSIEVAFVRYEAPPLRLSRQVDWKDEEGKSEIEGRVLIRFSGRDSSSKGNITTIVRHKIRFKSHVETEEKEKVTSVEMENKARTHISTERDDVVIIGQVLVDADVRRSTGRRWARTGVQNTACSRSRGARRRTR